LVFAFSNLTAHAAEPAHVPLRGLPAVVDGQIFKDDRGYWDQASTRFTAVLQRKFPPGFDEHKLAQTLLDQGFEYLPGPKPGCVPEKDVSKMPVGKAFVPCPTYDPHRTLAYEWPPWDLFPIAWVVCGQHLSVAWQAKSG